MKHLLKKNSPVEQIDRQIAVFEHNGAKLEAKKKTVEQLLTEHQAAMLEFVRANPEADPPAELRHALALARDHLEVVVETIAEGEQQIADLREARIIELELVQREETAVKLERAAGEVDRASRDMSKAVGAVVDAIAKLETTIPQDMATFELGWQRRPAGRSGGTYASATETAAALLAEALFNARPDIFDIVQPTGEPFRRNVGLFRLADLGDEPTASFGVDVPDGLPAEQAAKAITDAWRRRAEQIRAGIMAADASVIREIEQPHEEAAPDPATAKELHVFVTTPFRYVGENGREAFCEKWSYHLARAVAQAAVEAGYAHLFDSEEGHAAYRAEVELRDRHVELGLVTSKGSTHRDPSFYADLGNPLTFDVYEEPEVEEELNPFQRLQATGAAGTLVSVSRRL